MNLASKQYKVLGL